MQLNLQQMYNLCLCLMLMLLLAYAYLVLCRIYYSSAIVIYTSLMPMCHSITAEAMNVLDLIVNALLLQLLCRYSRRLCLIFLLCPGALCYHVSAVAPMQRLTAQQPWQAQGRALSAHQPKEAAAHSCIPACSHHAS